MTHTTIFKAHLDKLEAEQAARKQASEQTLKDTRTALRRWRQTVQARLACAASLASIACGPAFTSEQLEADSGAAVEADAGEPIEADAAPYLPPATASIAPSPPDAAPQCTPLPPASTGEAIPACWADIARACCADPDAVKYACDGDRCACEGTHTQPTGVCQAWAVFWVACPTTDSQALCGAE